MLTATPKYPTPVDKKVFENFKKTKVCTSMLRQSMRHIVNLGDQVSKDCCQIESDNEEAIQHLYIDIEQELDSVAQKTRAVLDKRKQYYTSLIKFLYDSYSASNSSKKCKEILLSILLLLTDTADKNILRY